MDPPGQHAVKLWRPADSLAFLYMITSVQRYLGICSLSKVKRSWFLSLHTSWWTTLSWWDYLLNELVSLCINLVWNLTSVFVYGNVLFSFEVCFSNQCLHTDNSYTRSQFSFCSVASYLCPWFREEPLFSKKVRQVLNPKGRGKTVWFSSLQGRGSRQLQLGAPRKWYRTKKIWLAIGLAVIIVVILLMVLIACHGFKCRWSFSQGCSLPTDGSTVTPACFRYAQ